MAYSRIQGKKLLILHSRRIDGKIKQEKLYTFESLKDASEMLDSESRWNLFCETLSQQFKIKIDSDKLKKGTRKKIEAINFDDTDYFSTSVQQVLNFLENCNLPISPKQKQMILKAKTNLIKLKDIIDIKLSLLDDPIDIFSRYETEVDKIFGLGLDCYESGNWDEAKAHFLQGLKKDPEHVDLLVYSGCIELIHENYSLALNYLNDAARIGKKKVDLKISSDPETYVKEADIEKWIEDKFCDQIDDCLNWDTEKCFECENYPLNSIEPLNQFFEFQPFFRSLTSKAATLKKLKRYDEAIDTLKLCQEYQSILGTSNMIGVCYLSIDDYKKADKYYIELLWNESFYIKALIKFKQNQIEEAFRYLFQGVLKNQHIAKILIGKEKPENIRYISVSLSDDLRASEFYHEEGYLFSKNPDFKILLRCILEDDDIIDLLDGLEKDYEKEKNNKLNEIDRVYWELKNGSIDDTFLDLFIPTFIERLNDKNLNYWKPKENEILEIQILKKNNQNWLVKLPDFENEFYFRPKTHIDCYDKITIKVTKSWFYRKRLFITGDDIEVF